MNFGKSIKIALLKNNMTQPELAKILDLHQSGISHMANRDSTSTKNLVRVAKAFGMKVSEFVALGED